MQKRTSLNGLSNSNWMNYAVSRTGVQMPNCFTYATARISEIVGYNQPLDNVKVAGASQLWEYHHPNFRQSQVPVPGALMIWGGGLNDWGHVAVCEDANPVSWSQSNYGGPAFQYHSGNPNAMYSGLHFKGYLVHKDLGKTDSNHIALVQEDGIAILLVDQVNVRLDGPNGKVIRTYSKGDKVRYTHKYIGNGHRYVVWEEHNHKVFMAVSATEQRPAEGSHEQWATFDDPEPKPSNDNVKAHGIDISEANGNVKYIGNDFVIARSSYGEYTDELFRKHIEECRKLSIPVGVYHFSYAVDEKQANDEINYFLKEVKDVDVKVGYWFDLEENSYWGERGLNTPEHFTMLAKVWDEIMTERGLYHGIYAGKYWFDNFIKVPVEHKWIADWGNDDEIRDKDLSKECVIHQYTSNHNTLDENVCYVDLSVFASKEKPKDKSNQDLLNDIKNAVQQLEERLG